MAANHDASYTVPLIINGEEIRRGKTFDVVSPETGKVVHNCVAATLDDAGAAVDAAAAAFKTWKRTTPPKRRDIFLKAAEILDGRREELIGYARAEAGIGRGWSDFIVGLAIGCLKDLAGRLQSLEGSFPATEDPNISSIIMSEPYGVVLAIAPWYVVSMCTQASRHLRSLGMLPTSLALGPSPRPLQLAIPSF